MEPYSDFKGHIHWNGDWDLEELYHGGEIEGKVMDPELAEPGYKYGEYINK